jgi:hypothetical protein
VAIHDEDDGLSLSGTIVLIILLIRVALGALVALVKCKDKM